MISTGIVCAHNRREMKKENYHPSVRVDPGVGLGIRDLVQHHVVVREMPDLVEVLESHVVDH